MVLKLGLFGKYIRNTLPGTFCSVVLEKAGDQLDQLRGK
jgi:hypothetical protein